MCAVRERVRWCAGKLFNRVETASTHLPQAYCGLGML